MKKLIIFFICAMSLSSLGAQESETDEESIDVPFAIVEEVPIFPGCEDTMKKEMRKCFQQQMQQHVSKNFRYPVEAQKQGIQGRVSTMFVIDLDGSITSIKTIGPNPILEKEARRIFSLLPQMKPGKQRGKPVRVPFSMPITFRLQ